MYNKNTSRNKNRKRARGKRSKGRRKSFAVKKYHQLEKSLDELGGDYKSTEMLIDEIEHHPELWNSNCDLYHDGQRKKDAWISVCHAINVRFDEKNSKEKAEICQVVMEKWENIKDCYAQLVPREKYLGKDFSLGKLFINAKNLTFLSLSQSISKAQSSIDDKVMEIPVDLDIKEMNKARVLETPGTVSEIKTEQSDSSYHNSSEMLEAVDIEPALDCTKSSASENDSDMAFLKSLHPLIKDFNDDQKLEFQCETMNVIKRIRQTTNQNFCNNSSQYSMHGVSYSPIISSIYSF